MTYQEKEISKIHLEKAVQVLDLDEGIRVENKSNMIFVNKSAKRFCVCIVFKEKEEFTYCNNPVEVLDFLKSKIDDDSRIFLY